MTEGPHALSFSYGFSVGPKSLRSLITCLPRTGQYSINTDGYSPNRSVPPRLGWGTPLFHTGVLPSCVCHSSSLVFFTTDDPEPPGGGTPTGLDQFLSQLHGPAQTAQEAVRRPPHPPPPAPAPGKRVGVLVFYFLQLGLEVRTLPMLGQACR